MVGEFPRAGLSCINGAAHRPSPPRDVKARASAWEAGNGPVWPVNMLKVLTSHKMPPMVPTKRPHQDGSWNRRGGALGERSMAGRHGGQLGRNPALSYLRRGGQMGGR